MVMNMIQEHLPQDRQARPEEEWGFTLEEFIIGNWPYLLGIIIILAIFLYARYDWKRRQR